MSRYKNVYYKRKSEGRCVKCGKPRDTERVLCAVCREDVLRQQKENIAFFKSIGICPVCGKNPIAPERCSCEKCLERGREYHRKKKNKYMESANGTV